MQLSPEDTRTIHPASHPAETEACKVQKNKIGKMLGLEVIKPAQTELGVAYRFCTEYARPAPILCWLPKAKRCTCAQFLSHCANGRVHRLARRRHDFLVIAREQVLLVSRNCRR